jgi:hypothetical protein
MPEGNTARCLYKGFGAYLGVPDKVRFAPDSPLEEAVKSEPVSEWGEFPASWENTGNSSDSGLDDANLPTKRVKGSTTYKQNSLRHGTGN